jgi:putative selenate reductase molybdopterin-binding subunit
MKFEAEVNGQPLTTEHEAGASLLTTLRGAGIHGPKKGCESGDCGCCTVWLNGDAVQSCLLPAYRAHGQDLTTIEGLATGDKLHPVQADFLREEGFQCGYCTAGMMMTLASPGAAACTSLSEKLRGNICRCTGWAAIKRAAGKPDGTAAPGPRAPDDPAAGHAGDPLPNRHGPQIITGQPAYTADFPMPGMLHLAVVRSPHAHARIRSIDTSAARAAPGVVAVFTHEDIKRIPYSTACHPGEPRDAYDTYLLDNIARFVGQRLVVVAAETKIAAQRACGLVAIDFEVLPHVLDPLEALKPGAPIVHPEPDSFQIADRDCNLVGVYDRTRGDPTTAFAVADFVVEREFSTGRQQHAHLEPHISTAWLDDEGNLVVRSSTQVPFLARRTLSRLFELPEEKIRVFKPRVGGGFGNKQEMQSEDLPALVALRTGRPAQWEYSRADEFTASSTRHPMTLTVRGAARADGTLIALSLDYVANAGAYGNHSTDALECAGFEPMSTYRCDHKSIHGRAVYTHTVPAGAFRGYGATQTTFAVECLIDDLAAAVGLDSAAFRRLNLVRADDPLCVSDTPAEGHRIGAYALDACLDHVQAGLAAQPLPAADDNWLYGQGHAVANVGNGLPHIHKSGARIQLIATGYHLIIGTADIGTGSDTALAQVAAQALQTPYHAITVSSGDTGSGAPEDSGAFASATTYMAGRAVQLAAEQLRVKVSAALASEQLTGPDALAQLHARLATRGEILEAVVANFFQPKVSISFAVVGIQLRVHRRTGRIELLRCVQAIDAGRLLNPRVCLGQAEGGTVMSLGFALFEELVIDDEGVIENPTFRDYRVPAIADVPPIETKFFEPIDPDGPFGAKSIGELTTNGGPAAVANALTHALSGRRVTTLPLTPERVWRELNRTTAATT